jgi:hypothetical protein
MDLVLSDEPAGSSSVRAQNSVSFTPTGAPIVGVSPAKSDNLWRALFELYELLRFEPKAGVVYQAYFERNPIVFQVLGFDTHASFERSSGNSSPFDEERNIRLNLISCAPKLVLVKLPYLSSRHLSSET